MSNIYCFLYFLICLRDVFPASGRSCPSEELALQCSDGDTRSTVAPYMAVREPYGTQCCLFVFIMGLFTETINTLCVV